MTAALKLATYEDLLALPENVVGEILYGVLHSQPRPAMPHGRSAARLYKYIDSGFDDDDGGPGGWWILAEPEVHLGSHVVVPDIAGWRRERMPSLPHAAWLELAPDWVCEVLSPSTARTDRGTKMRIYAEAGVAHVWLVDPIVRTIEAYARDPQGRWILLEVRGGDEDARLPPFEAIAVRLPRLWLD